MDQRPNCYECHWRGTIPGDAHSRCLHPDINWSDDLMGDLVKVLDGTFDEAIERLNITANPHGVKKGWFLWPVNFDPVWLRSCAGFMPKGSKGE